MKIVMLDTNVVIDLFKNYNDARKKLIEFKEHKFAISYLVYAEFMSGTQLTKKKDSNKFLKLFKVFMFDAKAHQTANLFLQKYFTGRENSPNDLLIAAHAHSLNYPVITNNAKDFIFTEVKSYHYSKSFWI